MTDFLGPVGPEAPRGVGYMTGAPAIFQKRCCHLARAAAPEVEALPPFPWACRRVPEGLSPKSPPVLLPRPEPGGFENT